jgi:hypothetical protein
MLGDKLHALSAVQENQGLIRIFFNMSGCACNSSV